jgi:hypothetical protein
MTLRPEILADLARHGVEPAAGDTPAALRARLNERYLDDVRALRERRRAGEIARRDYAAHVEALKRRYALLGLPLPAWSA